MMPDGMTEAVVEAYESLDISRRVAVDVLIIQLAGIMAENAKLRQIIEKQADSED